MIRTAVVALIAVLASILLSLAGQGGAAALHLAFALGIVPLIYAAITHFVPVLTRTGDAHPLMHWLPTLAQLSGLGAVAILFAWLPRQWMLLPALIDMALAAILLYWVAQRARRCLGSPHPSWRWYVAALACLLLALLAITMQGFWPEHHHRWRSIHLHLNTLGLIGFAALGTLPVLLPTALGQGDPLAASWLRRWLLPLALGMGAMMLSLGSDQGLWRGIGAVAGSMLYLAAGLALAWQWLHRFGLAALLRNGVGVALLTALLAFNLLLLAGLAHGLGLWPPRVSIAAWFAGFLLPLVSGALSQLLPVWRFPGRLTPQRTQWRATLAAGGQWRSLLFLLAAGLFLADLPTPGALAAAAGMLGFAGALLRCRFTGSPAQS